MATATKPSVEQILRWRRNPISYVRQNFQVDPDPWQAQAIASFFNFDIARLRLALQACAGPGKSAVLAWCGWGFLSLVGGKGEHPKGAAISVTSQNLKDNLWSEFSKWQQRSPYLMHAFTHQAERIFSNDHPTTWFLSARSWSKKADAETQGRTLSGIHSEYVLILIDESGEIPVAVVKAGEQALSGCKFGRIVQAGNPTSREGILYAAASVLRHLWQIIRITGDPDNPERSTRIDLEWAKEQIATFGRDNPWVMSMILGEFPPSSINSLLGPDEVEAAMQRTLRPEAYTWAQKRLGVDVARFGNDRTVIFPRQGLCAFRPVVMRLQRTTDIAARVMKARETWGSEREYVDDSGHWGHGVFDNLNAAGVPAQAVLFEDKAINPRYFNRRAEMWMELAGWIKTRRGALPFMPELVRELTAPTYTYVNGKIILEDKKLIKKRIGFSPDLGDGLALTFAEPDLPALDVAMQRAGLEQPGGSGKVQHEWDPFTGL